MNGHRILVEATLLPRAEGGIKESIRVGHRSAAYRFDALAEDEQDQGFGAAVEAILAGGEPGSQMIARLCFYHPGVAIYATPGAQFRVWYGRVVGHGVVIEVLPEQA